MGAQVPEHTVEVRGQLWELVLSFHSEAEFMGQTQAYGLGATVTHILLKEPKQLGPVPDSPRSFSPLVQQLWRACVYMVVP